jgi:hypothetical protein
VATALDTTLIPKIKSVIEKYGKTVTIDVSGLTHYDPDSGSVIESGTVTHTVKVTPPENFNSRWIDGDLIQEGDAQVSMSPSGLTFTPENGHVFTIDNQKWKIVRVQTEYTGDDIGLYVMQLRR